MEEGGAQRIGNNRIHVRGQCPKLEPVGWEGIAAAGRAVERPLGVVTGSTNIPVTRKWIQGIPLYS